MNTIKRFLAALAVPLMLALILAAGCDALPALDPTTVCSIDPNYPPSRYDVCHSPADGHVMAYISNGYNVPCGICTNPHYGTDWTYHDRSTSVDRACLMDTTVSSSANVPTQDLGGSVYIVCLPKSCDLDAARWGCQ